ncbi:MAG: helical backbone metal receptor [Ferruginibacter sp.]
MFLSSPAQLISKPIRIISLVPSQTELLYHLGLDNETIGITKFCIHPAKWFGSKTRVGGTKSLNIELIRSLRPDLIIANKEENVKEQITELAESFPTWLSDVNTLEETLQMIKDIGQLTGKASEALLITGKIEEAFAKLTFPHRISAAYLIWNEPMMTVGGDCFISNMLFHAGFDNVFKHLTRYPQISLKDINDSGCKLLLLSSEPYPFKQKHINSMQPLLPGIKIMLTDGEMFSWYGSRLLQAPAYFGQLRDMIDA